MKKNIVYHVTPEKKEVLPLFPRTHNRKHPNSEKIRISHNDPTSSTHKHSVENNVFFGGLVYDFAAVCTHRDEKMEHEKKKMREKRFGKWVTPRGR